MCFSDDAQLVLPSCVIVNREEEINIRDGSFEDSFTCNSSECVEVENTV